MANAWLTVAEAADRIARSQDTIWRWARDEHLTILLGRVSEAKLLEVDQMMRNRRGRPRKTKG